MSYKGNVAAVEAEAERIVEELRSGAATAASLMRRYRVGYLALMRVVYSRMTRGQWAAIARRNHARGGEPRRFKKGHATWNEGRKGISYPGSRATQFKPGCIRGQAATYRHAVKRRLAAMEGPRRTVWDCPACGHGVQSPKRPRRCAKCGGHSLEKLLLREAV